MPTFASVIKYSTGATCHSNKVGKIYQGHPNKREEIKLLLFADVKILHLENPKDSTITILVVIDLYFKFESQN